MRNMIWLKITVFLIVLIHYGTHPLQAQIMTEEAAYPHTVIWYLPHPDDETLGMAGAIMASIQAENRNIFIFLTQGGGTLVRLTNPNTGRSLGVEEIKEARVREATDALLILGACLEDIVFLDYPDGSLTVNQVSGIVRDYHRAYPDASHYTVSVHDQHPDHKVTARAVAMVAREATDGIDVAYYRVYIYHKAAPQRAKSGVSVEPIPDMQLKKQALASYSQFDPSIGRYAIGSRSVPNLIKAAANDPCEYRDVQPVPMGGFQPLYLEVGTAAVSIGREYTFANTNWHLDVKGEISEAVGMTFCLSYKLRNLPALGRVYAGGAYQIGGQNNNSTYLVFGAHIFGIANGEIRQALLDMRRGVEFHWGVRLYWP